METAQIWDASADTGSVILDPPRKSLYVEIFENILSIVLEHEEYLFSSSELTCFDHVRRLSYPARYLLIRLCLCKRGKWHTLPSLEARYMSELGDNTKISDVIDELCGLQSSEEEANVKVNLEEGREVIDLTLEDDEDGEPVKQMQEGEDVDELSTFAVDDMTATVPDLLDCLSVEELKIIAKQLKVNKPVQNVLRSALIDAILSNASQQSTLGFPVLTPRDNSTRPSANRAQTRPLASSVAKDQKKGTQHAVVRRLVSKLIGRCVRMQPAVFALFDRLNIVFFRSTTHSPSLLLPALLSAFRKRQYGSIGTNYSRSANIFPSRDALLAYEEALLLEYSIDENLGWNEGDATFRFVQQKTTTAKTRQSQTNVKEGPPRPAEGARIESAKAVRKIWEKVYDRWEDLVSCKDAPQSAGFERFEYGHVLTRIVYKGAQALAILKEYEVEIKVLRALISQKKWRRGRRGAWYDRLALVLMTHCERTQANLEMAMEVVINGLQDELTHMTYRPRLERRLTRLENMLKIPKENRHKCDGKLQKPREVFVEGVRVYKNGDASAVPDISPHMKGNPGVNLDQGRSRTPHDTKGEAAQPQEYDRTGIQKGKTVWVGRHGEEVSVEQFALEYYEDMGFRGFHSEGSIVSTIFGILFWDIIFSSIPGAFETPYQLAPLDIHEDSFFPARKEIIERRLQEVKDGKAGEIVREVDERERGSSTMCIGVDWTFERDDLLEIVHSLGGDALSVICRMICEDYSQWRGGVPDLFVWNAETGACKFVEVKSPKDTLQENQKVWIDVLLGSGTAVDLCHVTETGAEKKSGKKKRREQRSVVHLSDVESEDDDTEIRSRNENCDDVESEEEEPDESDKSTIPTSRKRKGQVTIAGSRKNKTKR